MKLTKLVRKMESQLKKAEKLAQRYDAQARKLRRRLEGAATFFGKTLFGGIEGQGRRIKYKKSKMSAAGKARIAAAQKKRWAAWKAKRAKSK